MVFDSLQVEAGARIECSVIEYMGLDPVRREEPHTIAYGEAAPRKDALYLLGDGGGLTSLDPLLIAHREDVYFLNDASGSPEYLSYASGERHRPSTIERLQADLFERILEHPVDASRLSRLSGDVVPSADGGAAPAEARGGEALRERREVRGRGPLPRPRGARPLPRGPFLRRGLRRRCGLPRARDASGHRLPSTARRSFATGALPPRPGAPPGAAIPPGPARPSWTRRSRAPSPAMSRTQTRRTFARSAAGEAGRLLRASAFAARYVGPRRVSRAFRAAAERVVEFDLVIASLVGLTSPSFMA